ncbi:MAG TPA: thiamine ABC transporter substrate-binding protein [Candidatus Cloacimonadota bacterium]|nr:thiamine ABC transporter substrate-binding protein [Candidatus Cloacimonadota bacterium]
MKRLVIITLVITLLLFACAKKQEKKAPAVPANLPPSKLSIYAIEQFRSSGLESVINREFSRLYNCTIDVTTFPSTQDLILATQADTARVDIVLGIPSGFSHEDTLLTNLVAVQSIPEANFSRELGYAPGAKLIPYGFGNLSIIYNRQQIDRPPSTFGDLQDARYISQMAICDPKLSGLGRSTLLWTVALFGEEGYKMLWRSLRKNVGKRYDTPESLVEALETGQYAMIIGVNGTAAWIKEQDPEKDHFVSVIPGEGSFLYVEYAAIHKNAKNSAIAKTWLTYLLSPASQRMVVYKLGLFPANSKTEMPLSFARVPIYSHSSHRNLDPLALKEKGQSWLDWWEDFMSFRLN